MISKIPYPSIFKQFFLSAFCKKKIYMKKSMASAVVWRLLLSGWKIVLFFIQLIKIMLACILEKCCSGTFTWVIILLNIQPVQYDKCVYRNVLISQSVYWVQSLILHFCWFLHSPSKTTWPKFEHYCLVYQYCFCTNPARIITVTVL